MAQGDTARQHMFGDTLGKGTGTDLHEEDKRIPSRCDGLEFNGPDSSRSAVMAKRPLVLNSLCLSHTPTVAATLSQTARRAAERRSESRTIACPTRLTASATP